MKKIERVIHNNICLGCGMCEAIYPQKCKMEIDSKGFYIPIFHEKLACKEDKHLAKICPSINVIGHPSRSKWGNIKYISEGWAKDSQLRYHAASGGATSALAAYLLESKQVDAILQIGNKKGSYLLNELQISETYDQIYNNAQSRYAPALVFPNIIKILRNSNKTYAFIGKPCDIAGIKNLILEYPEFKNRIKFFIAIFCAGMPSYNSTHKVYSQSGRDDKPQKVKYRGDGWPGEFTAEWEDGHKFTMNYCESWGNILGKTIGLRCKMCPDGIGLLADIAIGDSWSTKDGYPDFKEQPGRCFILIRTNNGEKIIDKALTSKYIECQPLEMGNLDKMQPYQASRRYYILWRLIPLQFKTFFLLNFKNLGLVKLGFKLNFVQAIRTMLGSFRRVYLKN